MKQYKSFEKFKMENIKKYESMIQEATQRTGGQSPRFPSGEIATVETLTQKAYEQHLRVLNISNQKD